MCDVTELLKADETLLDVYRRTHVRILRTGVLTLDAPVREARLHPHVRAKLSRRARTVHSGGAAISLRVWVFGGALWFAGNWKDAGGELRPAG